MNIWILGNKFELKRTIRVLHRIFPENDIHLIYNWDLILMTYLNGEHLNIDENYGWSRSQLISLLPLRIPFRRLVCSTLYKDKNSDIFGVNYASCGPTIRGGWWQGSGQGVNVPPLHVGLVYSCHASSFIKLYKKYSLYKKRGTTTMKYSMYKQ